VVLHYHQGALRPNISNVLLGMLVLDIFMINMKMRLNWIRFYMARYNQDILMVFARHGKRMKERHVRSHRWTSSMKHSQRWVRLLTPIGMCPQPHCHRNLTASLEDINVSPSHKHFSAQELLN
jgi:hypothetical protein